MTAELDDAVDVFSSQLTSGKFLGSLAVGTALMGVLKRIVGQAKWSTSQELVVILRKEGNRVAEVAAGANVAGGDIVGNIVRRVIKLVREEASHSNSKKADPQQSSGDPRDSLHSLAVVTAEGPAQKLGKVAVADLKAKVIDSMEELQMELETASDEISNAALEHIHANEIILTIGRSRTVELFLKQAARERPFQVIVAEAAGAGFQGQEMAASLAKAKIPTTVITDSAVFALMSRVNKVIIGANAIMADGGLRAVTGSLTVALAAQHYSVPLYVCASMFKLTPDYCATGDREAFCKFVSPEEVVRGMDGRIVSKLRACAPLFEYVPPDLVTLFISNISGHSPSYVYRLLSEFYDPEDYDLTS